MSLWCSRTDLRMSVCATWLPPSWEQTDTHQDVIVRDTQSLKHVCEKDEGQQSLNGHWYQHCSFTQKNKEEGGDRDVQRARGEWRSRLRLQRSLPTLSRDLGRSRACVCVCLQEKRGPGQHCLVPRVHPCLFTFSSSYLATCLQGRRGHGNEFTALVRGQLQAVWTAHVSVERYRASNPVKVHFKSPSLEFLVAFGSLRLKYWERHCKNCLNRAMGAVSYEQTAWWETDPDLEREGSGWTHCMLLYTPNPLVLFSHFRK